MNENAVVKAYKGFDKNLKCRGFQYEIGKEYEHDGPVEACESGFHACEAPLDVFPYYAPATSRYCEVEQSGELSRDGDDSKIASSRIKIGAEIGIPGLVKAQIEWVKNQTHEIKGSHATDYQGAASATGDFGAASATGDYGAASATGDYGAASATGYRGAASATGGRGAASATGDCGAASATGEDGAAMASGRDGRVMGALGNAMFLVERGGWNGDTYPILNVAAFLIDGDKYKPDTWYTLKNGEIVEAE